MPYNIGDAPVLLVRIYLCLVDSLPPMTNEPGALVVSLDFELEWGVVDTLAVGGGYRDALLGARKAVPRMLDAFQTRGIAATWATVGFLFAESRDELDAHAPGVLPHYANPAFDPYRVEVGRDEKDDPIHYAPSLLREIASRPRQEIGSHTYSHFYCLEEGATAEAFDADLASAVSIAAARGVTLRSLVFPRNQIHEDFLPIAARHGLIAFRGPEPHVLASPRTRAAQQATPLRAGRLLDAHVALTGDNVLARKDIRARHGIVDVPGSRFLRPFSTSLRAIDSLRIRRIVYGMKAAARRGGIYHLWWHPHNFGRHMEANFAALDVVLATYAELRESHGFASLTMSEAAECATFADVPSQRRRT